MRGDSVEEHAGGWVVFVVDEQVRGNIERSEGNVQGDRARSSVASSTGATNRKSNNQSSGGVGGHGESSSVVGRLEGDDVRSEHSISEVGVGGDGEGSGGDNGVVDASRGELGGDDKRLRNRASNVSVGRRSARSSNGEGQGQEVSGGRLSGSGQSVQRLSLSAEGVGDLSGSRVGRHGSEGQLGHFRVEHEGRGGEGHSSSDGGHDHLGGRSGAKRDGSSPIDSQSKQTRERKAADTIRSRFRG